MSSRARRLFAALATATSLFLPSLAAHAQGVDEFGGYGTKRGEQSQSKQEAAFEIRLGRYLPEVDSQVAGSPFKQTFGGDTRFMLGMELDWQLLRIPHFGTLSPGVGWGLTKFTAKAPFSNGSGYSATDTRLWMMPMYLVGVARADVVARDFKIPIVPYAKFGFGYGLWWSSDGKRSARDDETGKRGKGASYGLTYALGAMFLLDVLDPDDAASADGLTGINNSYVFGEWFRPQLDGFGKNTVLDISSSSWVVGIALEI